MLLKVFLRLSKFGLDFIADFSYTGARFQSSAERTPC